MQISDILDGYLARQAQGERRQNPTGEILDPIADKLYINGAYLTLMAIGRVPGWAAGVIVARDALIIVGWLLRYLRSGVRMLPNVLGKMADSSQAMFLIVLLAGPPEPIVEIFLWLAVSLTAASGLAYARVALAAPQEA